MFGSIGGFEMLVLMAIGLLVFGPRKLPEVGRTLGKAMVEFRRAAMELRSSIEREISLEELKDTTRSVSREMEDGLERMKPAGLLPRIDIPNIEMPKLETPKLELPGFDDPGVNDEPSKPRAGPRAGDGVKRD